MAVQKSRRANGGLFGSGRQIAPIQQTPIQPAPVPSSPHLSPPRYETGSNLTKLAQALSNFNQSLNNLANTQAIENNNPNSRANQEWIAKRQQMSLDELKAEVANDTAQGIKVREDALNMLAANKAAAQFKNDFFQFYATEFDKTSGDVDAAYEQYRMGYAQTLPSEIARGSFYQLTDGFKNTIVDQDTKEKIDYTLNQIGSALTDSFRNTISDAATQGKTPDEAASLVFGNAATMGDFMRLSPQERDQAIINLAKEYASQGEEDIVRALLKNERGDLGKALVKDYGSPMINLINQAANIKRSQKQDKDWRTISAFKTHVKQGTLDEDLAAQFEASGSISAQALGEGLVQSQINKEAILERQRREEAKQQAANIHQMQRMEHVARAYEAMNDIGGITYITDVEIPNESGTGKVRLSASELVKEVVKIKEQEWQQLTQAAIDAGEDPDVAINQADQMRLKWYADQNIENKLWSQQFSGLASRALLMDLTGKDKRVEYLKQVVNRYQNIASVNPAYAATLVDDKPSREFLESYNDALALGMDEDTALLDAAQTVSRPENEKRKTQLNQRDTAEVVEHLKNRFGLESYNDDMLATMAHDLSRRGATKEVVMEKLEQDLERRSIVINGHLVFNHKNMPPDFSYLVGEILSERLKENQEQMGLGDDPTDLFIEANRSNSHWLVHSKSLGGAIIGEPITPETLALQRESNKERRLGRYLVTLSDSLNKQSGTRHEEKMRRDRNYHAQQTIATEINYWQQELESQKSSWPSQIIENNIYQLEEDLIHFQAEEMISRDVYPDSEEWKEWEINHSHDVSHLRKHFNDLKTRQASLKQQQRNEK